jgi:hypothetical protein
VSEKDALLGAVFDGEEGEAGWVPEGNRYLPHATSTLTGKRPKAWSKMPK